jgi:curved DNA-binding protein
MEQHMKDYYAVLGVAPDASDETIKKSFRKLARQYHPDVNPGDTQAEERFKEINEAHQAIGDPEKRKEYDMLRQQYEQWQRAGGSPFGYQQQGGAGGATYTQTVSPEDLRDIFSGFGFNGGEGGSADFFDSVFGRGGFGAASGEPRPRRGRDAELTVELTLEEAFSGTTRTIQVDGRRIEASIPRGVRTSSRVRLAGQGYPGAAGGEAGDLYLVIGVQPHPQFERDRDDLIRTVPIDVYTAAVGGEVRVPTLDGAVMLKIPPRTQGEQTFRLRGKGMPKLGQPDERGDMYARVRLVLPADISDAELDELRSLRERYHAA